MIKLSFLSCLVLLISIKSEAQQRDKDKPDEPAKKANEQTSEPVKNKSNRIILFFNDTAGIFTQFAKILTDRSYDFETKDREVGIIKTKVRDLPGGWSHSVQIRCLFRDSTVTLSATQPRDFSWDIFYMTRKGSTFYQTWNELLYLGNQLKPYRIAYSEAK